MFQIQKIASLSLTVALGACVANGSIGTTDAGVGGADATGGANSVTTGGAPSGGAPVTNDPVTETLSACSIPTTGSPSVQTIDVPTALTGDNWGAKQQICEQGGWDLTPCAGQSATFTTFASSKTGSSGNPMTIWVASLGKTVCCVYAEETNTNGAGYPVPCERDAGITLGTSCMPANDYDYACTVDSDCVAVPGGDPCSDECHCSDIAVNASVASQYRADFDTLNAGHTSGTCSCPCLAVAPCCRQGVCRNLCGYCQ